MGIRQMQGTPAHLEYITSKNRKCKYECAYLKGEYCCCEKAKNFKLKCVGRKYCKYYDASKKNKEKLKNEINIINKVEQNHKKFILSSVKSGKIVDIEIVPKDKENNPILRIYSEKSTIAYILKNHYIGDIVTIKIGNVNNKYKILNIISKS